MAVYRFSESLGTNNVYRFSESLGTNNVYRFSEITAGLPEGPFDPDQLEDLVGRYKADETYIEHSGTILGGSDRWKRSSAVVTAYPFVVSTWFKPDDGQPAALGVIWSAADEVGTNNNWHVRLQTDGTILLASKDGTTKTCSTVNTLSDGQESWHHILAVFHSATDREIYLDGDAANSGTNTTNSTPADIDNMIIGDLVSGSGGGDYFTGDIGRVDLWTSSVTGSARDTLASNLARGDDPATTTLGTPDHTWFDQSTDGTDSIGTEDLSSEGSPTAHSECYIVRDLTGNRHLIGAAGSPDWSDDANGLGKKGLVFDDVNTEHLVYSGTQAITAAPFTVWTWFTTDADGANQCLWYLGETSSEDNWRSLVRMDLIDDPYSLQANEIAMSSGEARTTDSIPIDTIRLGTAIEAAADDRTAKLDGSGDGTDATSRTPNTPDTLSIGYALDNTPDFPHSGTWYESIFIDDTPTSQEESDVETYGTTQWGAP